MSESSAKKGPALAPDRPSPTGVDAASLPRRARQIAPVGSASGVDELLVGALMYSAVAEVTAVARFIESDDLDPPASTVLISIRALAGRGFPPSPQLVKDDLHRRGQLTRTTAAWLAAATTSGACGSAAKGYAAAVHAESFRRQAESFGAVLVSAAPTAAEGDLARLAEHASARIRYTYGRLTELRGDVDD